MSVFPVDVVNFREVLLAFPDFFPILESKVPEEILGWVIWEVAQEEHQEFLGLVVAAEKLERGLEKERALAEAGDSLEDAWVENSAHKQALFFQLFLLKDLLRSEREQVELLRVDLRGRGEDPVVDVLRVLGILLLLEGVPVVHR